MTITEARRMLERAERQGLGGVTLRVEVPGGASVAIGRVVYLYPQRLVTVDQRTFNNVRGNADGAQLLDSKATFTE